MQRLIFPSDYKAADEGRVTGYASIAGEVDLGGDAVAANAFVEIKANAKGHIPFLWGHQTTIPIGTARVTQDQKGLAFDAQLVMDDPAARTALAHFKAGTVSGVSIGFDILADGTEFLKNGVRLLKRLRLWEISAVVFPACEGARIESVKSKPETIGELENLLRSFGYSKSETKRLLAHGWRGVSDDEYTDHAEMLARSLKAFYANLKGN